MIATAPEVARTESLTPAEIGQRVRAIHGDAPYMRLEPDRVYEILLRSTGEIIITPGTRLAPPPTIP